MKCALSSYASRISLAAPRQTLIIEILILIYFNFTLFPPSSCSTSNLLLVVGNKNFISSFFHRRRRWEAFKATQKPSGLLNTSAVYLEGTYLTLWKTTAMWSVSTLPPSWDELQDWGWSWTGDVPDTPRSQRDSSRASFKYSTRSTNNFKSVSVSPFC